LPSVGESFGLILSGGRRLDLRHLPKIDHVRFRFLGRYFLWKVIKNCKYGDVQEKGEPDQV
jgi:hypothetical protein